MKSGRCIANCNCNFYGLPGGAWKDRCKSAMYIVVTHE